MRTESLIHFFFVLSPHSLACGRYKKTKEGGAQEITADPLCSPLPLIFTHSGNTSQIKACITTRVCICVCVFTCPPHTQGVFSCPDPCSLNCVHADLTHTHTHSLLTTHRLPSWLCFLFLSFEAVPHYEDTMGSSVCLGQ